MLQAMMYHINLVLKEGNITAYWESECYGHSVEISRKGKEAFIIMQGNE